MANKDQEDLAQFNYRHPGEPETIGTESKEDPDGDDKAATKEADAETKRLKHQSEDAREGSEGGEGVSPNKGMSDPKSQKEIDDENTHSPAR